MERVAVGCTVGVAVYSQCLASKARAASTTALDALPSPAWARAGARARRRVRARARGRAKARAIGRGL